MLSLNYHLIVKKINNNNLFLELFKLYIRNWVNKFVRKNNKQPDSCFS